MQTTSKPTGSTRKARALKSLPTLALAMMAWVGAASTASAVPLLGAALKTFAVLAATEVSNVPTSAVFGNVGVYAGSSITGFTAPRTRRSDRGRDGTGDGRISTRDDRPGGSGAA